MQDYERKRDHYYELCRQRDAIEHSYLEATDATARFLLAVANETVGVGDIIKDIRGELKVVQVNAAYAYPDDRARAFRPPVVCGVRRLKGGEWGKREVRTWSGSWSVLFRAEPNA